MMCQGLSRILSEPFSSGNHWYAGKDEVLRLHSLYQFTRFRTRCSLTEGDTEVKDEAPSEHLETKSAHNPGASKSRLKELLKALQ